MTFTPQPEPRLLMDVEKYRQIWRNASQKSSSWILSHLPFRLDGDLAKVMRVRSHYLRPGVLVVNPKIKKTIFRKSMKKYDIPNPSKFQKEIEVIRYSKAVPGHMNREFIPLFNYLGVPSVFFLNCPELTSVRRLS